MHNQSADAQSSYMYENSGYMYTRLVIECEKNLKEYINMFVDLHEHEMQIEGNKLIIERYLVRELKNELD